MLFDPVTDRSGRLRARIRIRTEIDRQGLVCNTCGKYVKKLYHGRCLNCAARIEEAKFHHRVPDLGGKAVKKGKRKVEAPARK